MTANVSHAENILNQDREENIFLYLIIPFFMGTKIENLKVIKVVDGDTIHLS
ncbi:MAG: hypothetical protein ACRD8K_11760 [Nitrososphaeraceae archaeon]